MRYVAAILLILIIPSSVIAGGNVWKFKIEELIMKNDDDATLTLIPIEQGNEFPLNCKRLTVYVTYSTFRWWFLGGKDINNIEHRKALALLKHAYDSGLAISFVEMGEGFGHEKGKPICDMRSRALRVFKVNDGENQILSYYKWP